MPHLWGWLVQHVVVINYMRDINYAAPLGVVGAAQFMSK